MLSISRLFEQEEQAPEEQAAAETAPNEVGADSLGKRLLKKAVVKQEVDKMQAEDMQSEEEVMAAEDKVDQEKSSLRVNAIAADIKSTDTDLQSLKAAAQISTQKEGEKVKALAAGKNPDQVASETANEENAAEQLTGAIQQETKEVVDIANDIFKKKVKN